MTYVQIIFAAGFLTMGVALQGAIGFGSGLLAVPLMLWVGIELPEAVALLLTAVTLQVVQGCWRYRDHIEWRPIVQLTIWRYVGIPIGIACMALLADAGREPSRQVVGAVLLVVLLTQHFAKVRAMSHVHPGWMPLTGTVSGIMAGTLGMGGPPLVLWMMAHDWSAKQSRAFLWAAYLLTLPINSLLLAWRFGRPVLLAFAIGFAFAPLVLVASALGSRLGDRLNRNRLRTLAFWCLLAIAVASIIGPFL